jgi:Trypsin-co-occurring domain 1
MPLVQFPLADGTFVLVESADIGGQKPLTRGLAGDAIQTAKVTFEEAIDRIKPAASVVMDKLRNLADPPDEIEVEFGLTLAAEAGALIAKTSVEGNYTVTLKWSRLSKAT